MNNKEQIEELEKQKTEIEKKIEELKAEPEKFWYIELPYGDSLCVSGQPVCSLFQVKKHIEDSINDSGHGLGKFKQKEVAEACRLALIGTLAHYQKIDNWQGLIRNYTDEIVGKNFLEKQEGGE